MNDHALQDVYRSVVIAKLLNAACAWWGFTTADNRNRIEAVVRRAARAGLYPVDGQAAAQLVEDSDDVMGAPRKGQRGSPDPLDFDINFSHIITVAPRVEVQMHFWSNG